MQRFNTLFIGKVLHHYPQLASTNAHALSLLSSSKPAEGTVISAFYQYDGRGQIGSKWESEAGSNITVSVILYPAFLPARLQFHLNQAVSLAVYDLVSSHLSGKVTVKWPNDIYVADNKIAGILIQNTVAGEFINASIIGIGINVKQKIFLSNAPNPTSFQLETQKVFDLDEIKAELYFRLEKRYLALRFGQTTRLEKDYQNALYRHMEQAEFLLNDGTTFSGHITGVDSTGKLLIDTGNEVRSFDFKQIKFI